MPLESTPADVMDDSDSPVPIAICFRDNLMRDGLFRLLADSFQVLASVGAVDDLVTSRVANRVSLLLCCAKTDIVGLKILKTRYPAINIVVFASSNDEWSVENPEIDVRGVLRSSISTQVLITCLNLVALGERVFSFPSASGGSNEIVIVTERRSLTRVGSSVSAEILVDGAAPIPCMIRNVSLRGAKIETTAAQTIPDQFHLRAAELDLSTQAKVVWRSSTEMGVKFPVFSTVGSQSLS